MATIPVFFFFWGPVLVLAMFWGIGRWSRKMGVARALVGSTKTFMGISPRNQATGSTPGSPP